MLSTLITSSQGLGVKLGLTGFSPYALLAIRSVLAVLVLLAIVWRFKIPFPSLHSHTLWLGALAVGAIQVCIGGLLYFWAMQYAPVGRSTLIGATQPFLMVIAAHYLFRDGLNGRKFGGLLLGFVGVAVVVLGRGADLAGGGLLVDLMLIVAASSWATGQLLVKFMGHRWHMLALVTVQMGSAAFLTTIAALVLEPVRTIVLTPQSVGGLIYLATVGTVGMFGLMFYTIRRYEVSVVSSFIFLQPVVAVILGWLLLGEEVTWTLLLSMAFVALGLVLVNRPGGKAHVLAR